MDGTLLNNKGKVSPEFYEVFKALKKRGMQFVVASGRQYATLKEEFESIAEDIIFVAENGSIVMEKDKVLSLTPLDRDLAMELIMLGRTIDGAELVLCTTQGAYVETESEPFIKEVEKYYVQYKVVENLMQVQGDILKVTLCDFKGASKNSDHCIEAYRDKVQAVIAGELWLDMMHKGVNKGVAIKRLQEKLDIKPEETMAFGDYLNDYEMLQSAYYSYAMENAHQDIKKVARYRAKSNEENGVVEVIKDLLRKGTVEKCIKDI